MERVRWVAGLWLVYRRLLLICELLLLVNRRLVGELLLMVCGLLVVHRRLINGLLLAGRLLMLIQ